MSAELPILPAAAEIVAELQHQGFETYIVGGAIRDILLGRTPKDFDIATAATPDSARSTPPPPTAPPPLPPRRPPPSPPSPTSQDS